MKVEFVDQDEKVIGEGIRARKTNTPLSGRTLQRGCTWLSLWLLTLTAYQRGRSRLSLPFAQLNGENLDTGYMKIGFNGLQCEGKGFQRPWEES